jgi:hypothetical protein
MPNRVDKVILTNMTVLSGKYGASGVRKIRAALNGLIAADKKRGLVTRLVALDDKATAKQLKAPVVSDATDPKQNKNAVDAVYRALTPDYLMLLGASDVIPHQDLKNPLYHGSKGKDPDRWAYGDVPYACEAPYSQKPEDFRGPTRVVGRLPDITGGSDPSYLTSLLSVAAGWTSVERSTIKDYFAITAGVWESSSQLSATNIFGNASDLKVVPPSKSDWNPSVLERRLHFFNCHGASQSAQFYGQPADGSEHYPTALDAAYIDGKLARGSIVAAECCYGAQLYSPAENPQMGICNEYLRNQGYAFFGSTTIAYGLSEGTSDADLMCSFFLERVLAGASLGRAALEARQKFVHASSPAGPAEFKTLAQYNLYGDPSITPVVNAQGASKAVVDARVLPAERSERAARRRRLSAYGVTLETTEPVIRKRSAAPPKRLMSRLRARARELGYPDGEGLSFDIQYPRLPKSVPRSLADSPALPSAYHVLFLKGRAPPTADAAQSKVSDFVLLIGRESGGKLVSIQKVHSR